MQSMKYTLMHKNICVVELDLDDATGNIYKIEKICNEAHLPVGITVKKGVIDRSSLNAWWLDRSIPASRSGIRKALETLNLANAKMLLTKCLGLSLSDQYWIRPRNGEITWEDVNFFNNDFTEDIGDVLLGKAVKRDGFDFRSPDNTSDGCLKKRWKIIKGKRCLIKAGSNPYNQQPFNEVVASLIAERLGIPHVPYTVVWEEETPYCICEDFITEKTELVSAWRVMQTVKKDNNTSIYQHYLNCCNALGVQGIAHAIDQMIVLDYIIANEDRHQNNFGVIRNADTLEWIGAAPIFDSGSSLGYDKMTSQIRSDKLIECKPFRKSHEEQLKLVTSFEWIRFDRLKDVDKDIRNVFDGAGEYMETSRKEAIIGSLMERIEYLFKLANSVPKHE